MTTGQQIPPVSNNELIRTTWGNFVANELNVNSLKLNGKVPGAAGPSATDQVMTGSLIVNASIPVRLRRSGNAPFVQFEDTTGATTYGIVQGNAAGVNYQAPGASATHRFTVNGVEVIELASGLLKTTGSGRFGNTTGNQVQVVDTNGGGDLALCNVGFFPSASGIDTPGTRGAYVGYSGEGFQVQAGGKVVVQSVSGDVSLEAGDDLLLNPAGDIVLNADNIDFNPGGTIKGRITGTEFLWGKTASNESDAGIELYGAGSAAGLEGGIRSTTNINTTAPNLGLYHYTSAIGSGSPFAQFWSGTTLVGSITQDSSGGIDFNATSDARLKEDRGPIADATSRLSRLRPHTFCWRHDPTGTIREGFFADEVDAVIPGAVTGTPDAVNPDGTIVPQQFAVSKLIPLLTAALQEALARIEVLEAQVAS